jgi:hypothetical protein
VNAATLITAIVGVFVAMVAGILSPRIVARHKVRSDNRLADVRSWEGMTKSLREQLAEAHAQRLADMAALRAEFGEQLSSAKVRITELERDLALMEKRWIQAVKSAPSP